MTSELPRWLATESAVKLTFQLLGFQVEQVSISGRQIDAVASRSQTFDVVPETWIVEITTEKVGAAKGSSDYQKLVLAQKDYPGSRLMLVSTAGFTDDQKATLRKLSVVALTYSEFESSRVNFSQYAAHSLQQLQSSRSDIGYDSRWFVDPEVTLRTSKKDDDPQERIDGTTWIDRILSGDVPSVCALLGDLGSGKTSLLQKALQVGCERYVEDPSNRPIPVYLPLGRYKQHSGDIEQMLMGEFRRIGMQDYPIALMRHFIDCRRVILLLDGLDEIHPIQNAKDVLSTVIRIFGSIGQEAAGVISCRRVFLETSKEELAFFGPYTANQLESVQTDLQKRLRGQPSTYLAVLSPFDDARIKAYLRLRCELSPEEANRFLSRYYGFQDMARTPVLLSMMATALESKALDPRKESNFPILSLYQAYTDRWIERDEDRTVLSSHQRRMVSQNLAVHMLWSATDSARWEELAEYLRAERAWRESPISDDEAELDIRKSGFLIRDLDDQYRFAHRSVMEFFAAEAELRRFTEGAGPRHFPTDGFRHFVAAFTARHWLEHQEPPFGSTSWVAAKRGETAIEAQLALLASATELLPAGVRVPLSGVYSAVTKQEMRWKQVSFRDMTWTIAGGAARFQDCAFDGCTLILQRGDERPELRSCSFTDSQLEFRQIPSWKEPFSPLVGSEGTLAVPAWIWDLATLRTEGVKIQLPGGEWKLPRRVLELCAEVFSRFRAGKTSDDSFSKGKHGEELRAILPRLKSSGWVETGKGGTRSKNPHMLYLGAEANAALSKLSSKPVEAQDAMLDVFPYAER